MTRHVSAAPAVAAAAAAVAAACTTASPRLLAGIYPIRDRFNPFSQAEVSLDEYMGVMLDLGWAEPGRDLEIAQLGRSGLALLVIVDIARLACALK